METRAIGVRDMEKKTICIIHIIIALLFVASAFAEYTGETIVIPCDQGGFNYSQNTDSLPPTAMIGKTRNINLHNNGREKRGGTSIDDNTITSAQIMGIYKYRLTTGGENEIVADINGVVYEDGNVITNGMAVGNFYSFHAFNDKLFIADGSSIPHVWNGSSATTTQINSAHSNWTVQPPFQVLSHRRGNSERLVFVNLDAVYLSSPTSGAEEDFLTDAPVKIAIDTNDGLGLQGCVEFGDRLICFSKSKAYRLDDDSTDSDNWGFYQVNWDGGVVNWRCIIKTDNNLVLMADDGTIYDVRTVEQYGDYKSSSLTRPAKIDKWITDNVSLGQGNNFHGIYDPNLRAIKYFVQRKAKSQTDTALTFFIDRGAENGWVLHGNWSNNSGYSASTSALIRDSAGVWNVYTGDYSGSLWKLEQAALHDNSNGFYSGWSGVIHANDIRRTKDFKRAWISAGEQGDYVVSITTRIDGKTATTAGFSMLDNDSTALVIGSSSRGIIGTNTVGGRYTDLNSTINVPFGDKGIRMHYDLFTNSTVKTFFIKALMVDIKPLSRRPD
jgi:hypothetical protein